MPARKGFTSLILVLIFAGLSATGLSATIQIFIRVQPREARVDTIRLTLQSMAGWTKRAITLNDGDKSYAFSGLRSGTYYIRAESPGFLTSEIQVVLNSFSRADHRLETVVLQQEEDGANVPESSKKTVSVADLSIPSEALDEMARAQDASREGRSSKALEHLEKAVQIHPELYQAYNNMAVEYTRLGQLEKAAQALEKSIEIHPDDAITYSNLAQVLLSVGQLSKASSLIDRSLELEPENSKSLVLLGKLHIQLGSYEVALDHFYQASQIDKAHHSHIGIGECLTLLGRYREALTEFRDFVDLFPDDPRTSGVKKVIAQLETDLDRVEQ